MTTQRFDSVLVANRGEIALRLIRGIHAAGLTAVAVYSDADAQAPHVRAADVAVRLGPAPATESYLSIPALLAAAASSGAQAVHPGYGFLSERAPFARACAQAGLVFVGPSADVIDLMGRKDSSRRVAIAAGVPVVPGLQDGTGTDLVDRAMAEVGLPLLVKAAAGGGGKGMRIVRTAAELPEALAAARREALAAFGDGTVLIERYVERGRHIEVQVIGDEHGTVLHLHERDCSTQRRYQKVLEEAPAPTISAATRELVTSAAVDLARQAGYVNAGTVEFLVDGEQAYLLEMNTRLQVEHPVTEAITGLDLVALQLAVAQGEPLPLTQEQVRRRGHAIEARVYAEDPDHGFLPQSGRAGTVHWSTTARVDAALESGQLVGTWYDPMLGKIISYGADREQARRGLLAAIDDTVVTGLTTNLGFLRRLVGSPQFRDATIDTAWLDREPDALPPAQDPTALWVAAASALTDRSAHPDHPFGRLDGWRLGGRAALRVDLQAADRTRTVTLDETAGTVALDGEAWSGRILREDAGPDVGRVIVLSIEDRPHRVTLVADGDGVTAVEHGRALRFVRPDLRGTGAAGPTSGAITAPMPGTVTAVRAATGEKVVAGTVLAVLEAMKMEHALRAGADGTVGEILVEVGAQVKMGQLLLTVQPDTGPESGSA